MKVSFDFDGTLDRPEIESFACKLIDSGYDVWITTCRLRPENALPKWNDDLFDIADRIGVDREKIQFTEYHLKAAYLEGFILHLDDDRSELYSLPSGCVGVCSLNRSWKSECFKVLEL